MKSTIYAIETTELGKSYKRSPFRAEKPALDSLNLRVHPNEVFGFLGKNGSGKTTTIKILCGLLRSSRGTASIHGTNVRDREARKLLGYLPENPYFYEYLTPRETIEFYGRLNGLSTHERRAEWDRLSEALDLRSIQDQRVRGFSKGMRQRLGFAVALVGNPRVLILDEPMSGLDPLGRRMIRDLILRARDEGKTVFFSSHVLSDVEEVSDRVGMLVDGKLHCMGRIDEILTKGVSAVELAAENIPEYVIHELARMAIHSRVTEHGARFCFAGFEQANDATRTIHAHDGIVLEITPVKESLEDYFIREQEKVEAKA